MSKILFTANSSWYLWHYKKELLEILSGKGFEVYTSAPKDEYSSHLKEVSKEYFPIYKMNRSGTSIPQEFSLWKEARNIIRKCQPDLIVSHTIKANVYFNLAKRDIPSMNVVNGLGTAFEKKSLLQITVKFLYRKALRNKSTVVFQNQADSMFFVQEGLIKKSQIVIIEGSGVDTNKFKPLLPFSRTDALKIIFVGRLLRSKGIMLIYRLFQELPRYNMSLTVVGEIDPGNPDTISEEELDLIKRDPRMEYMGFRKDIGIIMRDQDLFLFPSYYNEGLPRAMLEAMSTSLPCLVANIAATRDVIVDGSNGFLVEANNFAALKLKFISVFEKKNEELSQIANGARETILDRYSIEKINEQYIEQINESIK